MSLLAIQTLSKNALIVNTLKSFLATTVCPAIASNSSICVGGTEILGGPLLEAINNALLDPVFFCE
jgi:hypothetical protein